MNSSLLENVTDRNTMDVKSLLENGSEVNAKDNSNETALIRASMNGHTDIVKMLLDRGTDVNAKNNYGNTALIRASMNGHTDTVALLLEKGADVNVTNNYGWTSLINTSRWGHKKVVLLIKNHIRRTELMKQILKTALIVKKGKRLTQKKNKPLVPYAHREMIYYIATFF